MTTDNFGGREGRNGPLGQLKYQGQHKDNSQEGVLLMKIMKPDARVSGTLAAAIVELRYWDTIKQR